MKSLINKLNGRWLSICTTWLGVYPLLTLLAWFLEPVLTGQHLAIRTLIMSLLMVPVMVIIVMPVMQKVMSLLTQTSANQNS